MPESPHTTSPEYTHGLPPVTPPSGKFLAQLFLVPFIIVTCLVGFALFVKWFAGSAWTPEEYLERLDNPNPDVRWRAAETLAQVLLRDDQLACNPKFILDLTDHLHHAWQLNRSEEKALGDRLHKQNQAGTEQDQDTLEPSRRYLLYLSACLGNVMVPIGAPLLDELATNLNGSDAAAITQRRRRALWALANLGENLKRFETVPPERRQTVLAQLADAASAGGERGDWARLSREYLECPSDSRSCHMLGVDRVLTQCAADPDPFLRELTAYALNFWEGTAAENAQMEALLVKLATDDGHGEETFTQSADSSGAAADEAAVTRVPGLKIRYNATIALARRGSTRVRQGVLQEMLDLRQQQENFRLKRKDGQTVTDATTVDLTVKAALQAVAELHHKRPSYDISKFAGPIRELSTNSPTDVRSEALRVEAELGMK